MRALVVRSADRVELAEIAAPVPGPYDALVQIESGGICGSTDAQIIAGTMTWAPPFPLVLGHESVERIVEMGARVTTFRVGDRVTRPIYSDPVGEMPYSNW